MSKDKNIELNVSSERAFDLGKGVGYNQALKDIIDKLKNEESICGCVDEYLIECIEVLKRK